MTIQTNDFYELIENLHQQLDKTSTAFDQGNAVQALLVTTSQDPNSKAYDWADVTGSVTPALINGVLQSVMVTTDHDQQKEFFEVIINNLQAMVQQWEVDELFEEFKDGATELQPVKND